MKNLFLGKFIANRNKFSFQYDFSGIKDGPFFLLIVKPTRKLEEFYAVPKTLVTGKREGAGIFFMHINVSGLHECKQNENSFDSVQEYLMNC